jgi:hypothetical protein
MTYEHPEEHVDNANESLRKEHAFPEIHRVPHFR